MKILYFVCGEGLGHATRAIAAGEAMQKNHEFSFASYGYVLDFLQMNGFRTLETVPEIAMHGLGGSLDAKKSVLESVKKFNPAIITSIAGILRKEKPDLVISDSFFTPVLVARGSGLQTWMIVNQTNPDMFFENSHRGMRLVGKTVRGFSDFILGLANRVLIPDFLPPDTICEKNISSSQKLSPKAEFIGPLVRKGAFTAWGKKEKNRVFVSIGGFGYRQALLEKLAQASSELPDFTFDLVAGPNGRLSGMSRNVKWHSTVMDPFPLMAKSSLFVCGGGHSTIMESICLGRPLLSVPDMNHFEQQSNAQKAQDLGIGAKIGYGVSAAELCEKIVCYSSDRKVMKGVSRLRALAQKQNGAKRLCSLADGFAQSKGINSTSAITSTVRS